MVDLICAAVKYKFQLCAAVCFVQIKIWYGSGKSCIAYIRYYTGGSIPYILTVRYCIGVFVKLAVYILVECGVIREVEVALLIGVFIYFSPVSDIVRHTLTGYYILYFSTACTDSQRYELQKSTARKRIYATLLIKLSCILGIRNVYLCNGGVQW